MLCSGLLCSEVMPNVPIRGDNSTCGWAPRRLGILTCIDTTRILHYCCLEAQNAMLAGARWGNTLRSAVVGSLQQQTGKGFHACAVRKTMVTKCRIVFAAQNCSAKFIGRGITQAALASELCGPVLPSCSQNAPNWVQITASSHCLARSKTCEIILLPGQDDSSAPNGVSVHRCRSRI